MPRANEQRPRPDRSWRVAIVIVALLGTTVLCARCWMLRNRPFIGSPDEAAYTHQAGMILAGWGFRVNYVQHFFRRYDQLPRAEDHYGPGMPLVLSGALATRVGSPDFVAVLPALAAGSLVLPLLTLLVAKRLGAAAPLAAGAGAFALLAPLPLHLSGRVLADVPFTCLILSAWLIAWSGRTRPAWRCLGIGAVLGVAYLLKPAALLHLLALAPAVWWATAQGERPRLARAVLGTGLGLALTAGPWMARNAALYGDPLYSANRYIGAGQDFTEDWHATSFRRVWWAQPEDPPPTVVTAVGHYGAGRVAGVVAGRLALGLTGDDVRWLTAALVVAALVLRRREGWSLAAYHLGHVCLLAAVFPVLSRYLLLLWPAAAALSAAALGRVLECTATRGRHTSGGLERAQAFVAALALGLLSAWPGPLALATHGLAQGPSGSADAASRGQLALKGAARWCANALPAGSVVMVQDCWRFVHYSGLPSVNMPTDSAQAIDAVVQAYGVTHLVLIRTATAVEDEALTRDYLGESRLEWVRQESPTGVEVYALPPPGSSTAMYGRFR